jgi:RHS repeat-associated protein
VESIDCSGIFELRNQIYLPMIVNVGTNVALKVDVVQPVANQPFGPVSHTGGDFARDNAFLYMGSAAIQYGLQPDSLDPLRAAVLRGRTCTRAGVPLAGVEITVLDHPEYGSTLSQADGMFDLAVNSGGPLTLNYAHAGYLVTQRQVIAAPRDYAWLPDVVLIPMDNRVTTANLTGSVPMQIARGNPVADEDGSRQATLLIPQGTTAQFVMPDGSTVPVSQLNIRATEYTVGDTGPEAMPGLLPPSSGYTYALEYSVDEAQAAGAVDVEFSQPLYHYVENFLNFPVGMLVPMGYYDRLEGAWFPSTNGQVIQIVAISGGLADLDTDGDGAADNNAALGITTAERQNLATLYLAGQSLWRVPIEHFTPWDCNWPYGPPPFASGPDQPPPADRQPEDKPDCKSGSIIECQNQTLGESIALNGTPFNLHYNSDRVPGRTAAYHLDLPLSGSTLPPGLVRIDLTIEVAGRRFTKSYPTAPNQFVSFTWDGLDAYGRTVISRQPASVRLGYVYAAVYQEPAQFGDAFAALSGVPITANSARQEITLWQIWNLQLGGWDNRMQGLGGWTLDQHHAYDPVAKVLFLGDGSRRSADSIGTGVINTFAGGGIVPGTGVGDGGPASSAELYVPNGLDIGPDGSLYIVESVGQTVRRVDPQGVISTVAGQTSQACYPTTSVCGDGGPATSALLNNPEDIAVGPDGSLYIADRSNYRIRRVAPDGIITTVAGTGVAGSTGNGGLATAARIGSPYGVEAGPDGSIYISDRDNSLIRKVSPDGVISTVVGSIYGFAGDGGPANLARLASPKMVKLGLDGSLYILDFGNSRIRRVSPDGIINTVAGTGITGFSGDGGPATSAQLSAPSGLAIGPDGSIYIGDRQNYRVRWISPDGMISTIAGSGAYGFSGDGGPATRARLNEVLGVTVGLDGSLYVADWFNQRVRRVTSALPGFSVSDLLVPSEDGQELYVFNGGGRHLRTLHALTGAVLYEFAYDADFMLTTVTDGSGNVSTIQRTGGTPTAIVGPDGQTTTLMLDGSGFLASITNPAGEAFQFISTPEGLLTALTNPRGFTTTFTYDTLGRLIHHLNATGSEQTFTRAQSGDGYDVTRTTAEGLTTVYHVQVLPGGAEQSTNDLPDGSQTVTVLGTDGTQTWQGSNGVITTQLYGPDPRWGMLATVVESNTTTLPGGLTYQRSTNRTAILTDPANPLSLATLAEVVILNGASYLSTYTSATGLQLDRSPEGREYSTWVNPLGQVTLEQPAALAGIHYSYDTRGRLISITAGAGSETRTVLITYNPAGEIASLTNAANQTTTYVYDAASRLTVETRPDGQVIAYGYDANGNLTSLTPPGQPSHAFSYSPVDLLAQYSPPDVNPGADTTQYAYNLDQQMIQVTRPDGQTIAYSYDSAGRPSTVTIARGLLAYAYDAVTGYLVSLSAPGGIGLNYGYKGILMTTEAWSGPVAGLVSRTYNPNFRVNELQINGSSPVAYSYDQDGLLVSAGALSLGYSPQNRLRISSTLGTINETVSYNSFAEPVQVRALAGTTNLYSVDYTHDPLGRTTVLTETIGGVIDSYAYSYDLVGRLLSVTKNGTPATAYTYDGNGNRLTGSGPGGTNTGIYDNQDRQTQYGSITFTYNAAGERETRTEGGLVTTYNYDALGNLMEVGLPGGDQITYLVDGQNRRIAKLINGVHIQGFLYEDNLRIAAELNAANQVVSRFVYATLDNVPDYMVKGGVTYRLLTDHLGSIRLVVNAADGVIAQRLDYDAFGNVLVDTNPGFQPFGFAGGLYDSDTHLVRFGARDYDPETGRWTATDPILFASNDPNLYAYAGNDPVNNRDPLGLADNGLGKLISDKLDDWACKQSPATCCGQKRTSCQLCIDPGANDGNPGPGLQSCEEEFQKCMSKIKK